MAKENKQKHLADTPDIQLSKRRSKKVTMENMLPKQKSGKSAFSWPNVTREETIKELELPNAIHVLNFIALIRCRQTATVYVCVCFCI